MANSTYTYFKDVVNAYKIPACIFAVTKDINGFCKDARFFVVSEIFKRSFLDTFTEDENSDEIDSDAIAKMVEGTPYYDYMPRDPKFEALLIDAAFWNKHAHTYVDTTKIYGYWTEDIIFPVTCPTDFGDNDPDVAYCIFMYTLNSNIDTGKFASVSPDISAFVIKTCLELRNESEFLVSMTTVTNDIRDNTGASSAAVLTYDKDERCFNVIAESRKDETTRPIKDIFSELPFEIVECWEYLLQDTNTIFIKDESDLNMYEEKAPEWVATLRDNFVKSLCLVPFIHKGMIIGYLYIKNFDTDDSVRIKETMELVGFFLASEVANHLFLEKLEYLSNVDMLTGVFNRNCMNINVDELSLKLKLNPRPFTVGFFDLNGLKSINDNGGHTEGDKLLVHSADLLKEIFTDDKIYRAGGDEFVIISFDTLENFEAKVKETRERANDPDWMYFAIGYYHDPDKGKLRLAMRYADEAMYKDKSAFYDAHPEKRR